MPKKLTTEQWIEKAKAVHGDRYDYSKTVYVNARKTVVVTCPVHGDASQKPRNHLIGTGCFKCGKAIKELKALGRNQIDQNTFIEKSRLQHGTRYDYSKSVFRGATRPVVVTCKKHGDFSLKAHKHYNAGQGCGKCSGQQMDLETFTSEARSVHGDLYEYVSLGRKTLTKSGKTISTVTMKCEIHGEFTQARSHHMNGTGCPDCCVNDYGTHRVYLVKIICGGEEMVKIGITNTNTKVRFSTDPLVEFEDIADLEFSNRVDAQTIEAYLHAKHKRHQFTPKVKFGGHTECFNIEALKTIKQDFGV